MVKVKILGISCSPRKANTDIQVKRALKGAERIKDVTTEFWSVVGKDVNSCDECWNCMYPEPTTDKSMPCPRHPDSIANELTPKVEAVDGLILGTPTFYGSISPELKMIMDRLGMAFEIGMAYGPGGMRNKVVGAVAHSYDRHGGHEFAAALIIRWAIQLDMIPVGIGPDRPTMIPDIGTCGGYWGAFSTEFGHPATPAPWPGFAFNTTAEKTCVEKDKVGEWAATNLGMRVAEMCKIVNVGYDNLKPDELYWPKGKRREMGYAFEVTMKK